MSTALCTNPIPAFEPSSILSSSSFTLSRPKLPPRSAPLTLSRANNPYGDPLPLTPLPLTSITPTLSGLLPSPFPVPPTPSRFPIPNFAGQWLSPPHSVAPGRFTFPWHAALVGGVGGEGWGVVEMDITTRPGISHVKWDFEEGCLVIWERFWDLEVGGGEG